MCLDRTRELRCFGALHMPLRLSIDNAWVGNRVLTTVSSLSNTGAKPCKGVIHQRGQCPRVLMFDKSLRKSNGQCGVSQRVCTPARFLLRLTLEYFFATKPQRHQGSQAFIMVILSSCKSWFRQLMGSSSRLHFVG